MTQLDEESMKKLCDIIHRDIDEANKVIKNLTDGLRTLQKLCKHKWKYVGRDSHHSHCECTICGETDEDVC